MNDCYILEDHKPVVCEDLEAWGTWFGNADRIVKQETVIDTTGQESKISTVFLALDHRFGSSGPPILFETMVFNGKYAEEIDRYSTWQEAESGHEEMKRKVVGLENNPRKFLPTKPFVNPNTTRFRLDRGEIIHAGNSMYSKCAQCRQIVKLNKWFFGSLHICAPREEKSQ